MSEHQWARRTRVHRGLVIAAVIVTVAVEGLLAAPTAAALDEAAPLLPGHGRAIAGQYIVVLEDGADPAVVAGRNGVRPRFRYGAAMTGFAAALSPAELAEVRRDPTVRYVEPDGIAHTATTQTGATWGIDRIDQATGTNTTYTYTETAPDVTAYVLDTGIATAHAEFGGRARVGFDAVGDGQNGQDCNGHGTHVAGTIGGARYGVAKKIKLVAVRVLDCSGFGPWSGIIAGIDWVTNSHRGASVANLSFSGGFTQSVNDAVSRSIASGVTYAVAAGNDSASACDYSPASTGDALTVAATALVGGTDVRAPFSNAGPCVDVFAPGSDITSAWIGSTTARQTLSGTSMATPHVAGLAALFLQSSIGAAPATVSAVVATAAVRGVVDDPTGSPNLFARKWNGRLRAGGANAYLPDGRSWYQSASGAIRGWLAGTKGTDPNLYLQRWSGTVWETVARSTSTTARERIDLPAASPGRYRFRVQAFSGSGSFDLWSSHPV